MVNIAALYANLHVEAGDNVGKALSAYDKDSNPDETSTVFFESVAKSVGEKIVQGIKKGDINTNSIIGEKVTIEITFAKTDISFDNVNKIFFDCLTEALAKIRKGGDE